MLNADLPESFSSSVVVQLEANGALKLLVLWTEDIIIIYLNCLTFPEFLSSFNDTTNDFC